MSVRRRHSHRVDKTGVERPVRAGDRRPSGELIARTEPDENRALRRAVRVGNYRRRLEERPFEVRRRMVRNVRERHGFAGTFRPITEIRSVNTVCK